MEKSHIRLYIWLE